MSQPRPSIRDVARAAGVSVATVSRVLNEHAGVQKTLRAGVTRAIAKLGYRTDATASAVMRAFRNRHDKPKRGTIALLSYHPQDTWHEPQLHFYTEIKEGARTRAERIGYEVEIFCLTQPGLSPRRLGDILTARGVRGALLLPLPQRTETLNFPWERFCAVKIGYMLQRPLIHRATTDYLLHLSHILQRCEAAGYRRIGYVVDRTVEHRLARLVEASFRLHQLAVPARQRVPIFTGELLDQPDKSDAFLRWFERHQPEAIICQHPLPCLWLRHHGLKLPRDVGFAAITTRTDMPEVTGMVPAFHEIGAAAIDVVAQALLHDHPGIPAIQRSVLLCGTWQEGSTLRPVDAPRQKQLH